MLAFLLYIHAQGSHSWKHALMKAAQSQSGVLLVFGLRKKKQRRLVYCQIEVFRGFTCFHSEMWKLLHRGIIVLMKKDTTWLVWLRVEAMKCLISTLCIYDLLFGLWCDTVVAFFIVWHVYMGKIQSVKQGKLLLDFIFFSPPYRICNLAFLFNRFLNLKS